MTSRDAPAVNEERAEPIALRRGKWFERIVKADWRLGAEGDVLHEEAITLSLRAAKHGKKRRGRMDMFIDETSGYVTIVEIKATDWDRVKRVTRLLGSHRRQVWKYIDEFDVGRVNICPGLIYPTAPKQEGLKDRIEEYLNGWGLQVVWFYDP